MAQLAVAVGGAGIGAIFGPTGAAVGFLGGSLIGAWLFAPSSSVEGPRLDDLRVTVSTYGKPIPIGFGTIRTGGNCIFSTDIQETKNKRKVGGKGGPSTTQTTYTYSASFAIAFAQREATHVLRLWADSKLIFDGTLDDAGNPKDSVSRDGIIYRIYLGTESQDVDPLIESIKGVGNTPAYKGLVYVVFEDMPLADYGNRIPSITAEISFNGTDAYPVGDVTPSNAAELFPFHDLTFDRTRPFFLTADDYKIAKVNYRTGETISAGNLPAQTAGKQWSTQSAIDDDGYYYYQGTLWNHVPIHKVDPNTLSVVASSGRRSIFLGWRAHSNGGMKYTHNFTSLGENGKIGMSVGGSFRNITFFSLDKYATDPLFNEESGALELRYYGNYGFSFGRANMLTVDRDDSIWLAVNGTGNNLSYLIKLKIGFVANNDLLTQPGTPILVRVLQEETFNLSADIASCGFITYIEDEHALLIGTSSASGTNHLVKFDIDSETVVGTNSDQTLAVSSRGAFLNGVQNGQFLAYNASNAALIDVATMETIKTYDFSNWHADHGRRDWAWDELSSSFYAIVSGTGFVAYIERLFLDRVTGNAEPLDTVVNYLSERATLTSGKRDTTDLVSDNVPGYLVAQQTSAKNAIAPLASAFFFDGVESDWVFKFVKAGRSGDFSVPNADIAAHSGGERPPELSEVINQEIELPRQVYVRYMDIDANYEPGEAVSPRRADLVQTRKRQELSYPIALTASQAKEIATTWLYRLWESQTSLKYTLSQKWILIDPTDVGTVTKDGTAYTNQVTQTTFSDFVIDVSGLQEDAEAYTQDLEGEGGRDQSTGDIPFVGITDPLFFDTTILRDVDANGYGTGIRAYGSVISYSADWAGAGYFKSTDNDTFEDVLFFGAGEDVEYGILTTDLSASEFGTWDRFRFLKVKMITGAPESATEIAVLNGANAALVGNATDGWEVLQWATVTDEGSSIYKIENLLRGRRGTNNFQEHVAGDYFILLTEDTVKRFLLDLDALNSTRYFAASSIGSVFRSDKAVAAPVVANALKPWSPSDVRADWDNPSTNDITVTWERRTRYGGPWLDNTGAVPLNEESEAYEADVIDSNGDVVRTFDTLTSETLTYTSAQQVTDFGSNQTEIRIKIYQISEFAGRGFVADETLSEG